MPELIIRKPGQGAARVSQPSREERWNDDDEAMKQWRAGTKALTVSDGTDGDADGRHEYSDHLRFFEVTFYKTAFCIPGSREERVMALRVSLCLC